MANYAALRDEIMFDPLARGYSGMTDAQIAANLNTADRTVKRPVSLADLEAFLRRNKIWRKLQASTTASAGDFISLFSGTLVEVDVDETWVNDLGTELKTDGVFTAAELTSMKALADHVISRAEEIGIPPVREGDVATAKVY